MLPTFEKLARDFTDPLAAAIVTELVRRGVAEEFGRAVGAGIVDQAVHHTTRQLRRVPLIGGWW